MQCRGFDPSLGAIHYAKVARPFALHLFQPFPNLPIFERKNAGLSEICVMDRCLGGGSEPRGGLGNPLRPN